MDQTNDQNTDTTDNSTDQTTATPDQEEKVSKAEYLKAVEEANKFKKLDEENKRASKERELADLQKNQEWQKVAEIKENEAKAAKEEAEIIKKAFQSRVRHSAIKEAASAAGLRKESIQDLRLIDFPEVKIETDNDGEVNIVGVEKAVQRLKTLRPHWFQSGTPNINPSSPSVTSNSTATSWDSLKKAETEYKKNPSKENESKYRAAIQSFRK